MIKGRKKEKESLIIISSLHSLMPFAIGPSGEVFCGETELFDLGNHSPGENFEVTVRHHGEYKNET